MSVIIPLPPQVVLAAVFLDNSRLELITLDERTLYAGYIVSERISIHGQWSSHLMFILAATGSAVGLGNIWKFPYITGENGGGAFVLVYLVCIAFVGIPIMMAEVLLGRRGRQSPINTMRYLVKSENAAKVWQFIGWSGVVAGFLILSYYSVIAGWALAYVLKAASGLFVGMTGEGSAAAFGELLSDPKQLMIWHTLFMVMTTVVVARGVKSGLEQAVKVLMPALFILLLLLVGYGMNSGGFSQGVEFLFKPDFSKITAGSVLTAMGHAFFTLSLGMGAIMVYGSYLPGDASIAKTSVIIAVMDTVVALLAGLAIFPIVFASGLPIGSGPGLIFQTLPIAFGNMPGGTFFGTLFFLLLSFAAWTSAISLIEPVVAWLVENRGASRIWAASIVGLLTWLLGIVTVMSFSSWAFEFTFINETKSNGMFDMFDILTANILLPLGGLAMAVFAGWVMKRESTAEEFGGDGLVYKGWRFVVRYITPLGVMVVFLNAFGVFNAGS